MIATLLESMLAIYASGPDLDNDRPYRVNSISFRTHETSLPIHRASA